MNVAQLASELEKGTIRPAYLVAGAEALLRDAALEALEARVLADGPRDFNFDRLETDSASPSRLEEALGILPLMARRRLVVLRESEGRGAGLDESWGRAIEAALAAKGAGETSVLVVVARKVDRRSRWVKAFRDPAAEIECEAPKAGRELEAFLDREARRIGIDLTADAAELLCERIGPNLMLMRQELEKLLLYVGDAGRADRAAVALMVANVAEESIWDLTDAIGQGRAADSLTQLAQMLGQGEAAQAMLGALASHFRRLVRVGHGERVAAPPFVARKL
ncbi:DNA polymerase III subunit delta, partial [Myxococcota bacterium]|nr:DNA polymerase III subunit delta [Myxococcota bacterium]